MAADCATQASPTAIDIQNPSRVSSPFGFRTPHSTMHLSRGAWASGSLWSASLRTLSLLRLGRAAGCRNTRANGVVTEPGGGHARRVLLATFSEEKVAD